MIRLAVALRTPEGRSAVEADLCRLHGLDLRDYYRRDDDGRRLLTLRQIMVRLRHAPWDSAYRHLDDRPTARWWSPEAEVTDDLRRLYGIVHTKDHADVGPHPLSPQSPTPEERLETTRGRRRMHEAADARERQRQAWIAKQKEDA